MSLLTNELSALSADGEIIEIVSLSTAVRGGMMDMEEAKRRAGRRGALMLRHLCSLESAEDVFRLLITYLQRDPRITVIALLDRLCTLEEHREQADMQAQRLAQEALDIFAPLADRLAMQSVRERLEGASIALLDSKLHRTLASWRDALETLVCDNLLPSLESICMDAGLRVTMQWDPPAWSELRSAALLRKEETVCPSVCILCEDVEECYRVLGIFHSAFRQEAHSFRDDINTPQPNGTQALQTTVILPEGPKLRCLIRTLDMQEYARSGIALFALQESDVSIREYLPWTSALPALESATGDAWHSVRRDILSNLITIYGDSDQALLLPEEATALDAALYVLRERAFWTEAITVDSREVPFDYTPLPEGAHIGVRLSPKRSVDRQWLRDVRTGYASSAIKTALGLHTRASKIALGEELLQAAMIEQRRGFLEEFEPKALQERLANLGFTNFEDVFVRLAEGTLEPSRLCADLFSARRPIAGIGRKRYTLTCTLPQNGDIGVQRFLALYQRYGDRMQSMKIDSDRHEHPRIIAQAKLTASEHVSLLADLGKTGATEVRLRSLSSVIISGILVTALIAFWNVDPVVAKWILLSPLEITPVDITIMRFVGLFLLCSLRLFVLRLTSRAPEKVPLPWLDSLLWLAAASLVFTGLFTYTSLQWLLPQEYINILYASVLLFPLLHVSVPLPRNAQVYTSILLATIALVMTPLLHASIPWVGWAAGIGALCAFSMFTIFIDEFKRRHAVAARLPALLAVLSTIALLLSTALLPFSTLATLDRNALFVLSLYSLTVCGVPYLLFYSIIVTERWPWMVRFYWLGTIFSVAAQLLVFGNVHLPSLIPLCFTTVAILLFYRVYVYPTPVEHHSA